MPLASGRVSQRSLDEPETWMATDDHSRGSAVRVLLIADMRSPHTWGWVDAVRSAGVVVLCTDGRPWPEGGAFRGDGGGSLMTVRRWMKSIVGATQRRQRCIATVRRVAGPLLAPVTGLRMRRVVKRVQPDVVHGMRIPHEALTALAACPPAVPLAISIWGSDLTYDASSAGWRDVPPVGSSREPTCYLPIASETSTSPEPGGYGHARQRPYYLAAVGSTWRGWQTRIRTAVL